MRLVLDAVSKKRAQNEAVRVGKRTVSAMSLAKQEKTRWTHYGIS
jgi:hypothetical protein